MTTNNIQAPAGAAPQQQIPSTSQNAASPPSKRDLASWWKTFKKNARREEEKGEITILLHQRPILWSGSRKQQEGVRQLPDWIENHLIKHLNLLMLFGARGLSSPRRPTSMRGFAIRGGIM